MALRFRTSPLVVAMLCLAFPALAQSGYGGPAPGAPPQQPPPQYGYGQPAPPQQPPPQYGYAPPPQQGQGYGGAQPAPGYVPYSGPPQGGYAQPYPQQGPPSSRSKDRSSGEIAGLYAASVGYGVGLGIWIDSEIGLKDPGTLLILPAVLGVAAPFGVYFVDQPKMPRGLPMAMAAGLLIGGGEGLGIAGTQFVTAKQENAWGFRGLGRSMALGATLGGVGGYVMGVYAEPPPQTSLFAMSGATWGTFIGSALGYGISPAGAGYGGSNDSAAIGGLVGFNLGLAATAGLGAVLVPSYRQLTAMWAGAGIGAAVSLPVFLFYAGDSTPPAKRGFVFTGVAMSVGIAAGALLTAGDSDKQASDSAGPTFLSSLYIVPTTQPGGAGLTVGGLLE